jgi:hypothetical protein
MPSNNRNCCCTKQNKAEVCESLSRIGKSLNDAYGLWVPETLYGEAGAYSNGHYFRDNQNYCYGPVITDQMVDGADARTADEVPTGGLSYSTNISQINFRNDAKSGTVNLANCEDCLRYHLTHKNTIDDSGGGQRYGRLYAILAQCDCNDYFQFNQDNDGGDESIFERFAWPTCKIEMSTDAGDTYQTTHDECPTGRTREGEENFDYKTYNEASASVQDGIPDDMGNTYFYLDYTPLLEEVRDSNHPNYINGGAAQTGTAYNLPSHASADPGDGTTRSLPNATLLTAGNITFASDTTSKQNLNQQYGGSNSRVPLNFCSGSNRASNYFKFGSGFAGTNTGTFVITAGGETKTYKLKNTGSPNASNQEFLGVTSAEQTAINFKTIVEGSNGHGLDKVMVELHGAEVYITKTTPGEAENNSSASNSDFQSACDVNPLSSFTGGTDKSDNMTEAGDNKGTFVIMKIDPAIDGSYDTGRAVYRAFKVIGFSQFPPTVNSAYTSEQGAIKELKLSHVNEIHFRMNPQDSSVYYGTESAIAESNGSSCYNASASNANTAQLGTGTLLGGLNTGSTTDNTKWQGGDPCIRTNAATGSQGAELKLEDYADFCKNSEYLPETITIVREFEFDANDPWSNAAVSDKRFSPCLGSDNVFSNWDDSGEKIDKTTVSEGITGPPWGSPESYGLSGDGDADQRLRLVFTYTRNTKASCNLVDAQPLSFGTVGPDNYAFKCPNLTSRSIETGTENYVCHYQLSSISDNQGGVIKWITDPAIYLEDTSASTANTGILLDRRYLEDSNDTQTGPTDYSKNGDSTIARLFQKNVFDGSGNEISHLTHNKQNNHRASACIDTPIGNSSTNPYIPSACENSNGSYYVYTGYKYGLGGGTSAGSQTICDSNVGSNVTTNKGDWQQSTFGGLSFCDLTDNNDDANTQISPTNSFDGRLNCTDDEKAKGDARPAEIDPVDPQGIFYGRTAYTGLGIPSYAPIHPDSNVASNGIIESRYDIYPSNQKYNYSDDVTNGGRGKNSGGHTFMPTFTIGVGHTAVDTKNNKQFEKISGGTGSGTRVELNGENFNRFRYECSTYVIPAGLYIFRIEEADKCSDDSGSTNLNTTSATNRCVFGISMPIPESIHNAHIADTSTRIHPKFFQWWEGFYRSYAQPGVKSFANSLGTTDNETKDTPSCLGTADSIFQGSMEWRWCREGYQGVFRQATLAEICDCGRDKYNRAVDDLLSADKGPEKICTNYNGDGDSFDPGTCKCGEEDCQSGGLFCDGTGGGGGVGDGVDGTAFTNCCNAVKEYANAGECEDNEFPETWKGNYNSKRLQFTNGELDLGKGLRSVDPPQLVSCKEAVVIKMIEDGEDEAFINEAWESTGPDTWQFHLPTAVEVCCLCESLDDLSDEIQCTLSESGGALQRAANNNVCVSQAVCCGNRAGCSINGRFWGPEVYPSNTWSGVLDRFEIRSGVAPQRIRNETFTGNAASQAAPDAWEQVPRNTDSSPTGAVQELTGSGFGSDARSQRLFYPPRHDDITGNGDLNTEIRFIKNPNPYLYTQIQYDPTDDYNNGSGTAGECGFCQSVIQGDSSKEYTTRFFGKKVAASSFAPIDNNFSTTHGLIHVSSLVDMGCSDRDYRSSGNGQLIWYGSFSQLDYFDYNDNTALTVVS